eukprot:m.55418 g.55418  ORF g.55418 m.55418 type:complete len:459 (+) comp7753_c0_seq1:105-1481(+)
MLQAFALFDSADPKARDELRSLWEGLQARDEAKSGYSSDSSTSLHSTSRSSSTGSSNANFSHGGSGLHHGMTLAEQIKITDLAPTPVSSTQSVNHHHKPTPHVAKLVACDSSKRQPHQDQPFIQNPIKGTTISVHNADDDDDINDGMLSSKRSKTSLSDSTPEAVISTTTTNAATTTSSFSNELKGKLVSVVSVDGARGPRTPPSLILDIGDEDEDDVKSTHSSMDDFANWDVSSNASSTKMPTTTTKSSYRKNTKASKKIHKSSKRSPNLCSSAKKEKDKGKDIINEYNDSDDDGMDLSRWDSDIGGEVDDEEVTIDEEKEPNKDEDEEGITNEGDFGYENEAHEEGMDEVDWTNIGFDVDSKPSVVSLAESDDEGEDVPSPSPKRGKKQGSKYGRRGRSSALKGTQSGRFSFTSSVASTLHDADIGGDMLEYINYDEDDDDDEEEDGSDEDYVAGK